MGARGGLDYRVHSALRGREPNERRRPLVNPDARDGGERPCVRLAGEDDRDVAERALAEAGHAVDVQQLAVADNPDTVGRVLHLVE
jgi:hypothetical protein